MSDNEFDDIPDDFADVHDVDWAQILGPSATVHEPTTHPGPEPPDTQHSALTPNLSESNDSSSYFSDDGEMNTAFLAELDRLEALMPSGSMIPSASTSGPPHPIAEQTSTHATSSGSEQNSRTLATQPQSHQISGHQSFQHPRSPIAPTASSGNAIKTNSKRTVGHASKFPSKRPRLGDSPHPITPRSKDKGKEKADDTLRQILSNYEDELTCPICCDLFVASHIGNPCGHNFCGDCGWKWHHNVENKNKTCPCCRSTLDVTTPMIPNISMDNTVEKHVKALALSGIREWEPDGQNFRDWNTRKIAWRDSQKKSQKSKKTLPPRSRNIISLGAIVLDAAEPWLHQVEDLEEEDPTYEDSDIELIPRPVQPARWRRRRAR